MAWEQISGSMPALCPEIRINRLTGECVLTPYLLDTNIISDLIKNPQGKRVENGRIRLIHLVSVQRVSPPSTSHPFSKHPAGRLPGGPFLVTSHF